MVRLVAGKARTVASGCLRPLKFMQIRKEIRVSGIVQGVGFRPYVYRLATDKNLAGNISNTTAGVTIEVQGTPQEVDDFLARLPSEAPVLAQITRVAVREIPCQPEQAFEILTSHSSERVSTLISPDVAVCSDCLHELFDPSDRRYLYPFINCTNCGPRFTIIRGIPYDRSRTSMSVFAMCEQCRAEYDDPANRRFHAQPNACWSCGPALSLLDGEGHEIGADPVESAIERLRMGQIVAVKGLGGFHLAVDALNSAAVARLRERKRRAEKPFAVMVADLEGAARFCELDANAAQVLMARERPVVLLPRIKSAAIAECVAPRQCDLGVFLPYTPVHHLLFALGKFEALVMTSGNISEEPIAIQNNEAVTRLQGIADCFLVHDREILLRCDDSVIRYSSGRARRIRRSRGYVPAPVLLGREVPSILAVGGELKNTLCITRGDQAFLSQHVGDLENLEAFEFFRTTGAHLSEILEVEPEILAYDLHPEYLSTKWALAQTSLLRIGVQHHHAHIASCMAENHLDGTVIGFALDGTGYGTDEQIWGGEALIASYAGFERAAHFAYAAMPGGAAAIREPWRMAVSYLFQTFGERFLDLRIPFVKDLPVRSAELVMRMVAQRINSPLTSSCGRLFDGVAALLGICGKVSYEAQAAIELEMLARHSADSRAYPLEIVHDDGTSQICAGPLFEAMVRDIEAGVSVETISRRFHNGVAAAILRLAIQLRDARAINRVCLSGGTFNNAILLEKLTDGLETSAFEVFTHLLVPAGDGGLSLGQALIAAQERMDCPQLERECAG